MALTDFLTSVADAIRTKDGTTEPIVANDFPQRILDIQSGGGVEFEDIMLGEITVPTSVFSITVNVDVQDGYNILGFFIFSKTFVKEYLSTGKDPKEYSYKTVGGCKFMSYDETVKNLDKTFITHGNDGFGDPLYSYQEHSIDNVGHTFTFNSRSSSNYAIVGDYFYAVFIGKIPTESVV